MADDNASDSGAKLPHRVIVRSYPKIILLYPTLIAAVVAGIVTQFWSQYATAFTIMFMIVMGLNMIVLSFDFPRTTSLTMVFLAVALVSVALVLNYHYPVLGWLRDLAGKLQPQANHQFFYLLAGGLVVIYVFVFIVTRFDYWEITHNELIHHHGILGNVNRYPAPQLKLEKEITDVFEFFLLRSGRLLMHPSSERRAVVLENVPNINKREGQIQELLRTISVRIHGHGQE